MGVTKEKVFESGCGQTENQTVQLNCSVDRGKESNILLCFRR